MSIVATVPSGATTGNVVVTVSGASSNGATFTLSGTYGNGYQYRQAIVLSHAKVPNTDQTNFPVLISGTYSFLANVANGGFVQNQNGYDIVFSSDPEGATNLSYEIDTYSLATGAAAFWVGIPTLSHTVDTIIYLFYGNPSITSSQQNKAGVWQNNYLSVYHLGNGTTLALSDSGSAGYTLTGSAPASAGKIGGGVVFNGNSSTYLYYDSVGAYPSGSSPVTLESWVQPSQYGGGEIFGYGDTSAVGSRDGLYWDGNNAWMDFGEMELTAPMPFDGQWHHLVSVYGGGYLNTSTDQLYLDGVLLSTTLTNAGIPAITTTELKIGGIPACSYCSTLTGSVDEVRVSSGIRSADWIATEFANQSSPSTFYTVENQATANSSPTIVLLSPAAAAIGMPITIQGYGFQPAQGGSTVKFNGVPATPTSWNDATIVVTVPAGATNGNVVVTVAGVASNSVSFTVLPTTIQLLLPNVGTIGEAITIQGYGFQAAQGTSTVTFNGTAATSITSWSSTSIVVTVPAGATTGNVVVTIGGVASNAVAFTVSSPYPNGYQCRRTIDIGHANVPNTDQTDFPVLISGAYSFLATVSNGGLVQNSNGYDIIFSQDPEGATRLDHEIDSYNPVTGTASFWVRIPTLSHSTDTIIYMFYGNPAIGVSQENKPGVWRNSYLSVYHFGNGTTLGLADSGSAGYTLAGPATAGSGKIGGAAAFDGVPGGYLYYNSVGAYPSGASPVTLESWVQFAATSSGEGIVGYGDSSADGSWDALTWSGSAYLNFDDMWINGTLPFDTNWHHLVGVYGGGAISAATVQLYIDGVASTDAPYGGTPAITTTQLTVGGLPTDTSCCTLDGLVDEVRVSSGVRSADWVATEFANQSSPSTFYTMEGQAIASGAPTIQFLLPNAAPIATSVTIEGFAFQASQGASTVTFNGVAATPTNWNDASVVTSVPAGATTGNVIVTVGGVASNAAIFTVLPVPNITGLSPSSGGTGVSVTITGTNFGSSQGTSTVAFNGTTATTITSWSATSIVAAVPAAATTGYVVVTVSGVPSNSVSFTVPPQIASLSQASGAVGASVTISGTNFGTTQGTSTVSFNGTNATSIASWSPGSITVTVPAGATTGNLVVTVGGVSSNSVPFTVYVGYGDSYEYRRTIVLSHANVPNTDQTNFPVLISGVYPYLALIGYGGLVQNSSGYDIIFSSDPEGATKLDHEIDSYDPTTGTVSFWVRIPTLSHTVDTTIYLFYGNPSITSSQQNIPGVWQNNYLSVYHLGNGTTVGTSDSGSAGYTLAGSATAGAGKIGGGAVFNGNNSTYLYYDSATAYPSTEAPSTLETWFQMTSNVYQEIVGYGGNGWDGSRDALLWDGSNLWLEFNNIGVSGPMAFNSNWHHLVGVYSGGELSITTGQVYLDGALISNVMPLPGTPAISTAELKIGGIPTVTSCCAFTGSIDEVRVSSSARSSDWIATEYANQSSPSTFYSIESQTTTSSAPSIQLLSPTAAAMGAVVSIQGSGFQSTQGTSTVTFNGVPASPSIWTDATITVPVPAGATTGNVVVTVGGVASNGVSFTVLPTPSITSLSPSSGTVGTSITITGTGFGTTQGASTVTFNGTIASTVTSWSATSIVAPVPAGATTGYVVVTAGGSASNGQYFTITSALNITSISPASGNIGAFVTISGSGFGATQGTSTVQLSGTSVPVASWSNANIVSSVPSGSVSGPFSVTVSGQTVTSATFTVTRQALPGSWLDQDVGNVNGELGSASYSSGAFTVTGSGSGYTSTDGFHFAYQPLSGNGSIIARVVNVQGNGYPQPAVMIRQSLNPGDIEAVVSESGESYFTDRLTTGGSATSQYGSISSYPNWMQLTRVGNTFTGYTSPDGVNWTQIGTPVTITMATNAYIGIATSEPEGYLDTTTFDNVSISTSTAPAPVIVSLSATTAAIGSQITINGSNFGATQSGSLVLLNSAPVTINSWSNTSIVFTIPAVSASGPVVVLVAPNMNASNVVKLTITTQPLPTSWLDADVGQIYGLPGSATYSDGIFTINGSGTGYTSTDGFHFAYQPLSGNGSIIARVVNVLGNGYPQPALMIRQSLLAGDVAAVVFESSGESYFTDRLTTGGSATSQYGSSSPYPNWMQLTRVGSTFTGYTSPDGVNWTQIGTPVTITMATNAYIGIAMSEPDGYFDSATFDNVSITSSADTVPVILSLSTTSATIGSQITITGSNFSATQGGSVVLLNDAPVTATSWSNTSIVFTVPANATSGAVVVSLAPSGNDSNPVNLEITTEPLPTSLSNQDVGGVGTPGSSTYSDGVYSVSGGGSGLNGTADAMQFVYLTLSGNGSIVARLTSLQGGEAGVMIRETLDSGATDASVFYTSNYTYMQDRPSTGASVAYPTQSSYHYALPQWLQLVRSGNTFTGSISLDGVNWTQISTTTLTMAQTAYIGLVTSGEGSLETATFDNVSINSTTPAPLITAISASTAAVGGQVGIIGSNFGATQGGSLVLLNGTPVTISLWSSTGIVFTIPSRATSGPLVVSVAPSMNDSNAVPLQVTPQPLPSPWLNQDVANLSTQVGTSTYSNGIFTVTGGGAGIQNAGYADGMQFAYQTLSGDGSIVARIDSLKNYSSNVFAEGGVMIRQTLIPNSAAAAVFYYNNAVWMEDRPTTGTYNSYLQDLSGTVPMWLKLIRTGNTFTGYGSPDGSNWTLLGTATITMPTTVYIGLAVSGAGYLEPATFDSVAVTPTPSISSVSPTIGPIGTSVTVTGTNFGATQGTSNVWFNGVPATSITSWTSSQIVAIVPAAATSGTGLVTVTVNNIPSEGSSYFTVINPIITSLVPPAGEVGGTIAVNGSGFGASQNGVVSINGATATVQSWSDTLVQVTVPSTTTGPLTVSNDGVISNSQTFTVSSAVAITSISPSSGVVATPVTINGSGFGATQSNSVVEFGGATATATSWTNSQIIASVPANAVTGAVTVTVAGITATGPTFTVSFGMTLTSSANPSTVNIPLTFTANVTPLAATGTVKFKDGSTTLGTTTITNGVATYTTSTLAAGSHSITGVYSGNSSYPSSTSPTLTENVMTVSSITVSPATLSLPLSSVERYVATAVHSDNSTQIIPGIATWTSTNTATATIDATGLMTAVGQGTTTIQATFNSVTGSSSLTVGVPSFRSVGSLNMSRTGHTATLLQNGQVLIVGGNNDPAGGNDTTLASAELYDPVTETFSYTGSLTTPRYLHTATLLPNGNVLIVGGEQTLDSYGDMGGVFTIEMYDPTSGTFSLVPGSLDNAEPTTTLLSNGMVLLQAWDGSDPIQLYDPSTGVLSNAGSSLGLPLGQTFTATLLNDGTVLDAGGILYSSGNETITNVAQLFNPATETLSATGNLTTPTEYQTATLLNTGSVLLAGGEGTSGYLSAAELYNPTAKTFSATANLALPRTSHTATLLSDGTVLVIGGQYLISQNQGAVTGTAELYSPTNQTFTGDGSLATPRVQHTATLLNDGTVLVVGGISSLSLTSAELYAPPLPVPTSVTISPALTSMVVGQTQQFKALDQTGAQRFDVTWSVNNPSLASFTSGSPMILTATSEGVVTLTATVEGVAAQLQITISPSWLQVTPATVNMLASGDQYFTAVDNLGNPAANVTWTVSNSSLATVTTGNPTDLTATAAGSLTLTATVEGVSAQAQIVIWNAGSSFPNGTVVWSNPPIPGFAPIQSVQAQSSGYSPNLYSVGLSTDGTQSVVQAFSSDGEQLWQNQMPAVNGNSVPDAFGGLIVTEYDSCTPGQTNPLTIVDLDPVTGQPDWELQAAGIQEGQNIVYCYPTGVFAPQIAIRGDGAAIITSPTNDGFPSVSVNGQIYPIPPTTVTNYGNTIDVMCCVGPPLVNSDDTAYLEYEVRNVVNDIITSDTLYLMQINPDNSSSSTILSSTTQNEALYPGSTIPDGQGGVLATWTISPSSGPPPQYPYQAADFNAGVVGTPYNLPFSPPTISLGQSPILVLGENGIAFATDSTDTVNGPVVASFNVISGAPNWSYQAAAGSTLSIVAASTGNGLVTTITDQTGNQSVVRFDPTGSPTSDTGLTSVSGLEYFVGGMTWLGTPSTGSLLATYADTPIDMSTSSFAQPSGNGGKNAAADMSFWTPNTQNSTFSASGTNQTTITSTLQRIVTALPLYNSCNSWLQGTAGGVAVSGLTWFQLEIQQQTYGHASFYTLGKNSVPIYNIGAITGQLNSDGTTIPGMPSPTPISTYNDFAFFFNKQDGEGHTYNNIGPYGYKGADPRTQVLTALHEMGHAIDVSGIQRDAGKPDVSLANDTLVEKNCRGLIEGPKINKLSPSSGPVGTSITINGQYFGDTAGTGATASTVTFNGVQATPTSWSQNQISVAVPTGATSGSVTVTVAGQQASKNFTVQ